MEMHESQAADVKQSATWEATQVEGVSSLLFSLFLSLTSFSLFLSMFCLISRFAF